MESHSEKEQAQIHQRTGISRDNELKHMRGNFFFFSPISIFPLPDPWALVVW